MRSNKMLIKQQKVMEWIRQQNFRKVEFPSILQIDSQADNSNQSSIFLRNAEALVWIKKDIKKLNKKQCVDMIKRREQNLRLNRFPKQDTMPLESPLSRGGKSRISKDIGFRSVRIHSQDCRPQKRLPAGEDSRDERYLYITSLCHGVCKNSEYLNIQKLRARADDRPTKTQNHLFERHNQSSKAQTQPFKTDNLLTKTDRHPFKEDITLQNLSKSRNRSQFDQVRNNTKSRDRKVEREEQSFQYIEPW